MPVRTTPTAHSSSGYGFSHLFPSLGHNFKKAAQKIDVDLDALMARPAVGMTQSVRNSFEVHMGDAAQSIGTIGFSFRQNGVHYGCCFKDNNGNDIYDFGVEVPKGRPYLHRLDHMCITEKLHILNVARDLMDPHLKSQLLYPLHQMGLACFNPSIGHVVSSPSFSQTSFVLNNIVGHVGLDFPEDDLFEERPEVTVLALEYTKSKNRVLIDCSEIIPRFLVTEAQNPWGRQMNMSCSEAEKAVEHCRAKTTQYDRELAFLCSSLRLWDRLESLATWLPDYRTPAP